MSVGKRLKKARKSLGLSLDDIKNKSKIKKSYLIALENDEYKKLPGEVYTKVKDFEQQSRVDIMSEVIKAIEVVSENPHNEE